MRWHDPDLGRFDEHRRIYRWHGFHRLGEGESTGSTGRDRLRWLDGRRRLLGEHRLNRRRLTDTGSAPSGSTAGSQGSSGASSTSQECAPEASVQETSSGASQGG